MSIPEKTGLSLSGGGLSLRGDDLANFGSTESALTVPKPNTSIADTAMAMVQSNKPKTELSTSGYAGQHLSLNQQMGMMSVKDDTVRRKQTDEMIKNMITQVQDARKKIDAAIEDFRIAASKANKKFADTAMAQMDLAMKGHKITTEDMVQVDAISQLAKAIATRFFETSSQLMDLQKINQDGRFGDHSKSIELIFDSRMKEISLLSERMQLLRTQEIHEIDMETRVRDQALKEQAQTFDALMQAVKLDDERAQQEFDNHLKLRQEGYQQEKGIKELLGEEKKVEGDLEIRGTQVENEAEIAKMKIKSDSKIEKIRIAAQVTTDLTKTVADVVKPKCSIM